MLQHWWLWLSGLGGITGIALLAIFGGPIIPLIVNIAQGLLAPTARVLGNGLSILLKAEIGGGYDIIQSGQRILFVATLALITWHAAVSSTWKKVHHGYWLTEKHYQVAKPQPVRRRRG